jgi:hypothetical protein
MPQINVLRPFKLVTPVGGRGAHERSFAKGEHLLDPENAEDAAVLAHPWIRACADGAIESPQQAEERLERLRAKEREAEAAAANVAQALQLRPADAALASAPAEPSELASTVSPAAGGALPWRPDYAAVLAARVERLHRLQASPGALEALKAYYGEHIAAFINDWGVTADPRNALLSPPRAVVLPFILFPKQREWIDWVLERARRREPGLTEKSRDCGVSWLAMALAASLCLMRRNTTIGIGSAKEDLIDRSGDPSCLLWKARLFIESLPPAFRGGWDVRQHSAHLRLVFPETGSAIVGEAGDAIGRGGRTSIFFIDESAHLERPQLIEASLSSNTDCRIDISSVAGMANPFAEKRHSGRVQVFTFHWRDDPRKGDDWYARQRETLDPVTLAAEVDIDYRASIEGSLIPAAWLHAAVGAAEKLGIKPSGARHGGFDVADSGVDSNCFAARHGVRLHGLRSWSGKNSDIYASVVKAFSLADQYGTEWVYADGDGLGAGVRGDARTINAARAGDGRRQIRFEMFRGSSAPFDPEGEMVPGRKNQDFFANAKAAGWWHLRKLFENVYRAVVSGLKVDPDAIISIDPALPELDQLLQQLSQPTYSLNNAGKVIVDKKPDGTPSPDRADAVMICYQPRASALETWLKLGREP